MSGTTGHAIVAVNALVALLSWPPSATGAPGPAPTSR
jgi:hypothetical protein